MTSQWFVWTATWVAVVGAVAARRHRSPRLADIDRELAALVARDAVDVLRAELRDGPVRVTVHTETTLRGPFLVVDAGPRRYRVRLYGEACLAEDGEARTPRVHRGTSAWLVEIADLLSQGWLLVLETDDGRRRYHGWQIMHEAGRAVASAATR